MRVSSLPYVERYDHLARTLALPTGDLLEALALARSADSGYIWLSPVLTRVQSRLETLLRRRLEGIGFLEVQGPLVTRTDVLAPGGWMEKFGCELMSLAEPLQSLSLSPTSEEPLLSYIGQGGLQSYRQLPMRLFEFRRVFRNIQRVGGLYRAREFLCCLMASLDADADAMRRSSLLVREELQKLWSDLGLDVECEADDEAGSFEFLFPYERGDRSPGDTVVQRRKGGDTRPSTNGDVSLASLAMAYRYERTAHFSVGYADRQGRLRTPEMCTYGVGLQRCLLALVDRHRQQRGIAFPSAVRPFDVHLLSLSKHDEGQERARALYGNLHSAGFAVAWDDRYRPRLGQSLGFADLFGTPFRVVIGDRNPPGMVEIRLGHDGGHDQVADRDLVAYLRERGAV